MRVCESTRPTPFRQDCVELLDTNTQELRRWDSGLLTLPDDREWGPQNLGDECPDPKVNPRQDFLGLRHG